MRLGKAFSIQSGHKPDYVILGIVLFLLLVGFLALASASSDIGKVNFNDTGYYLKQQLFKGLIPGLIGFAAGFFIYYRRWKKAALILFVINLILLLLVFTPLGREVKGSHRWINLGIFSFQPSELLKLTYILYVASLFSGTRMKKIREGWKAYGIFVFVSIITGVLIFAQPATTMAMIIIGAGLVMYFLSGNSFRQVLVHFLLTLAVGAVIVAGLAAVTPYRLARVAPIWNPIAQKYFPALLIKNAPSDNFHVSQSLMAIGTGGLTGVGFGKSTSKYSLLPEPMGDSIFAVIAEEFGFAGSMVIILLFLILLWRGIGLALHSHDDFARLSVAGFSSIIAIQAIIHISANAGILPFTGVPLPFISYGGTSMAVTLTMIGIIANVSRHSSNE